MIFYLGTHRPSWLWRTNVPLFVSRTTLAKRRTVYAATVPSWCLDSGAFSQVALHGGWTISPEQYADEARWFRDGIGHMVWAAPQDWMCEPHVLQKTGKRLWQHQTLTVDNFVYLRGIAPDVPWIPVLQGWTVPDYERCARMYERAGVNLTLEPTVGVGSVCRRQRTKEGAEIMRVLSGRGYRLHGFGFKQTGLVACASVMQSADSMAWSMVARYSAPLIGHRQRHKNCANCMQYALLWRRQLARTVGVEHWDGPPSGEEEK